MLPAEYRALTVYLFCRGRLTAELAQRYKTDGMLAYVELIQRKEKEIGCDVLTHQKWYVVVTVAC